MEGTITDAVDNWTATMFAEKMHIGDKPTSEAPMDIVIPEDELSESSGDGEYSDNYPHRHRESSVKDGRGRQKLRRQQRSYSTDSEESTEEALDYVGRDYFHITHNSDDK